MKTIEIDLPEKPIVKSTTLVSLFIICFLSTAFGGVISTLMSVYLPVVVKEFQVTKTQDELNTISGFINAVFILGWAIGGFMWGVICDKTGRKASLLLSIGSYGIFTILTGLMPNWIGLVICRFMSGFGVGGVLVVSVAYLTEVWPERSRAVFIGIISISFPVGIFSAGLINYFVSTWRQGFLVGIVPVVLAIAGIWILKESEMWVNQKSNNADKSEKDGDILFSATNRKALMTGAVIFSSMLIGMWAIFSWMPTWIQSLIATDAPKERGLSMMFLGMGGLTGGFLSGWLVNFVGLRKSLTISFSICTIMSFILFKTNNHFSSIIYIEIAVLALFFGASQGILSVYIPLLFPTPIRATATGFCFNVGRIFTALAVLFVGILVTVLGGYSNSLFIFSLIFLPGLFAVLFIKDIG